MILAYRVIGLRVHITPKEENQMERSVQIKWHLELCHVKLCRTLWLSVGNGRNRKLLYHKESQELPEGSIPPCPANTTSKLLVRG